jgi:hypothetical protein
MMKLNSLARALVIGPEGGAEDGAAGAGVGEGAASVDVLVVSSSRPGCRVCYWTPTGHCAHFQTTLSYASQRTSWTEKLTPGIVR